MQSSTALTYATVLLIVLSAQLATAQTPVTTKAPTQPSTTTGQIDS